MNYAVSKTRSSLARRPDGDQLLKVLPADEPGDDPAQAHRMRPRDVLAPAVGASLCVRVAAVGLGVPV